MVTVEYIKQHFYDSSGNYKRNTVNTPQHSAFFKELKNHLRVDGTIGNAESLYIFLNPDKSDKCKMCGAKCQFKNVHAGYRTYCSNECRNQDKELSSTRIKHAQKTLKERYGADNAVKIEKFKDKIKQTNVAKYGTPWFVQSDKFLSSSNETKNRAIIEEFSGNAHDYLSSYNKGMSSVKAKHGRLTPRDYSEERNKRIFELEQYLKEMSISIVGDIGDNVNEGLYDKEINLVHSCGHAWTHVNLHKNPICPLCHRKSSLELSFIEWCKTLNVKFNTNVRSIIPPLELDLVFPDKKIAIELNGLYWHSSSHAKCENMKGTLVKTNKCLENGYTLISIWEHEWNDADTRDKLKSIIRGKLGLNQRIFARKLRIVIPTKKECKDFLLANHLQGFAGSSISVALADDDGQLLALMTLARPRFSKKHNYEIIRFCTKSNTNVIGAASRLFNYVIANFIRHGESIITYADRRFGHGGVYEKLGMSFCGTSAPNYLWWKYKQLLPRGATMKKNLNKLLGANFDPRLSEDENMFRCGYRKLMDAGNNRFEFIKPNF